MDTYRTFLLGSMVFIAILIIIAVIRSAIGPTMTDRIICVNMIGTMTIVEIAMLSIYKDEDYLVDVCLIYAMISFLSVVILTKIYTGVYLEKKGIKSGPGAIRHNLRHQVSTDKPPVSHDEPRSADATPGEAKAAETGTKD